MAMKRKSGQGGKAAKAAKTTKAAPNGAEFEHVKKDQKMKFASWIHSTFPPDDRLLYSKELTAGPQLLRPFHLSWRADFGLSAIIEPDNLVEIVELILLNGFRTDGGTLQGVEKLSVTKPDSAFLESKYKPLPPLPEASDTLPPFSVAYVKGWRRSVSCLIICEAIKELGIDMADLSTDYKAMGASMKSVYAIVAPYDHVQQQVLATRGISCAAGVRRPPNCFNMIRQIEVLDRAGVTEEADKVLASAANVARVYKVGPREANAIVQLSQKVTEPIQALLKDAVRKRGMRSFLTHEAIGKEIFSLAWSSGSGQYDAWNDALTNKDDNELVSLLIRRMCSDWDKQGTSRKAWSSKELVPLHVSCGGFLAFMRSLKDKIAPGEYSKHEQSLKDQFMVGALDPEIVHVLQTTVPPASLEAVSFLRAISEDIAQKHRAELEEKDRELALKVADATLNQVKAKLLADIEILKAVVPTAETEAKEAGLDLKKGQAHTKAWMEEHCKFVVANDGDNMVSSVKDIAQHISKLQEGPEGSPCQVYTLVLVDVTVFPANAKLVNGALDSLGLLLNMSAQNVGHIQLPVCHTNTSAPIVYKHRRLVEDNLMNTQKIDISQTVALHFSKPDEPHGADKRGGVQTCLHAEFARSVVAKKLGATSANWPVFYFGLLRDSQKDVIDFVEETVYTHWDGQPNAPPKTRVREVAQAPDLKLILWQNHRPVFPISLLSKFSSDSDHHAEIKKLKNLVEGMWPASSLPGDSSTAGAPLRAVESPDLSGVEVLDVSREVSLSMIPMSDFSEERLAVCPGKGGKPSVLITKTFEIYLGNPTDDEMLVQSCDIIGFYTGTFEIKIIKSAGPLEKHTIPWRLDNDMTLVAYEKKVMPLCVFMCNQARERGIGDSTVGDHEISPMTRAAGEGDSDGQAVLPYRYEVKPLESFKTNCYKSNPLGANTDSESHKPWTIGATMLGNFDKLPRQENNKTASLVWEARGVFADRSLHTTALSRKTEGVPHVQLPAACEDLGAHH
ncbi:unnamed protein product [Cladocopium goreaui]|uniref:Uncharacterized protein n=1 Tax=Cladocopium goreaui TaxID=2562237 RepID=A0A9P1GKS4_9DINO|nr:unnamed protein product [Cladocopium goreaui]